MSLVNIFKTHVPRKTISKVIQQLSGSFVSISASLLSDSPDSSLTCELVYTTSSRLQNLLLKLNLTVIYLLNL